MEKPFSRIQPARSVFYAPTLFSLLLMIVFLVIPGVSGQSDLKPIPGLPPKEPVNLTPEERAWIAEHPAVSVCIDPAYEPIEFVDDYGSYSGLALDYLERVGESTGLNFQIETEKDWNVCVDRIKHGGVDLLSAIYISDLRKDYLLFTRPYYRNTLVIVTKTSAPESLALEQLNGKSVAVVNGYTSHLYLAKYYPGIIAVPVPDVKTGLNMVAFGSADAYLGDLATVTAMVEKQGISNLKVSGEYEPSNEQPFEFAFGVRKDQPLLVSIMDKGIAAISDDEKKTINKRWISPSLGSSQGIDPILVTWLMVAVVVIACVIIIVLLLNRALRRLVAQRTADLERELEQRHRTEQALRESEERNAAIIAAIPDILFIISRDGTYLDVRTNDPSRLARSKDQIIGASIADIGLEPAKVQEILAAVRRAMDTGQLETVRYHLVVPSGAKNFEARLVRLDADRVFAIVQDVSERRMMHDALNLARGKMSLLNTVTFQDIEEAVFSLSAYTELLRTRMPKGEYSDFLDKEAAIIRKVSDSLVFARTYQDMGIHPPTWQNVNQVFLYAISHLDLQKFQRAGTLEDIEIFADPLLERALYHILDYIRMPQTGSGSLSLSYSESGDGLKIIIAYDGASVPLDEKTRIFTWYPGKTSGWGLYLAQQILSITGISIRETGEPGKETRFEIGIPKGGYRFSGRR